MDQNKMEETRIVLLGKTGSGKSTLCNTIFGENVFEVCHSPVSGTKTCAVETREVNKRKIKLIDTPGVFDTDPDSTKLTHELRNSVQECGPGPHAFLIVLKVEKFTPQEQAIVDVILKYFSEEALKYTTVVFTHGEDLPDDTKIENWVLQNPALNNLIQKCGGRCHVFDNKHWNNDQDPYRNNQVQIENLLNTIQKTVRENGEKPYSNEMLQKASSDKAFLTKLAGISTGVLLGALLGIPVMILCVIQLAKNPAITQYVLIGGAVVGAAFGGWKGYEAAEQAETPKQAAIAVCKKAKDYLTDIKILMCKDKGSKLL